MAQFGCVMSWLLLGQSLEFQVKNQKFNAHFIFYLFIYFLSVLLRSQQSPRGFRILGCPELLIKTFQKSVNET